MKVSIITLHKVRNYGSVLQALATQNMLGEYFDYVEIINYVRENVYGTNAIKSMAAQFKGIKKIVTYGIMVPTYLRWNKVFDGFIDKYLHVTNSMFISEKDFQINPPIADCFCVGSDQVWNSGWNHGIIPYLYLNFVPDNKLKFSFSSSFGKEQLDESEKEQTREYISRFKYLSVREKSAVDILNELGIQGPVQLVDPTLLMTRDYWLSLASERLIKNDYILIYQLNRNPEFDNYADNYAKYKKMKLVRICIRYDQFVKSGESILLPTVEEFLSLFNYASYIITDSFHATAFCINFNKQFIDIFPNEYSTRLKSVLQWAGLEDRQLKSFDDFEIADKQIKFDAINEKLNTERIKAHDFLKSVRYGG